MKTFTGVIRKQESAIDVSAILRGLHLNSVTEQTALVSVCQVLEVGESLKYAFCGTFWTQTVIYFFFEIGAIGFLSFLTTEKFFCRTIV